MRIFITGQKSFAIAVFNSLRTAGHQIVGVACPPHDKVVEVLHQQVPIVQTNKLYASAIPAGTDLIVCAHNHFYITHEVRKAARLGAISYHPSLLPRHRGRDAIEWAIRMHDAITGGTVYWVDDGVDTGDIAAQEWCWIEPGMTASDLWRTTLFPMGVKLLTNVVDEVSSGIIFKTPQNEKCATFEPAFNPRKLSQGAHA